MSITRDFNSSNHGRSLIQLLIRLWQQHRKLHHQAVLLKQLSELPLHLRRDLGAERYERIRWPAKRH